jgi:hypothetical protein
LPKPTLIAIQELLEDDIYIREKIKEEELKLDQEEMDELESNDINEVQDTPEAETDLEASQSDSK